MDELEIALLFRRVRRLVAVAFLVGAVFAQGTTVRVLMAIVDAETAKVAKQLTAAFDDIVAPAPPRPQPR